MRAFSTWPASRPLAALVSATSHDRWGTISVLAAPLETHTIRWRGHDARAAAESCAEMASALDSHGVLVDPSRGLWIIALSYEWGGLLEPTAMPRHRPPPDDWPLAVLCWCPHPHIYSHTEERWLTAPPPSEAANDAPCGAPSRAEITHLESDAPRADFERSVARTVEYIRAGDIFQANIAQRFSARWSGSPRAVARAAFDAGAPRYGAYIETPTHALASMSPELFLQTHADGRIVTRPVKGTRAMHESPAALAASEKDAAELHMIVDLMRNDLGRVCLPGSVHVADSRAIETHATVHHGVAEVSGTLRSGVSFVDLLRATFPPGSVTGAPKVRAMQIIDELEPTSRGPYCGAIGFVARDGVTLSVGIRTICMHRDVSGAQRADCGTLRYSAGCGIVAESEPHKEYEESLHKTAVMIHAAHALRAGRAAG